VPYGTTSTGTAGSSTTQKTDPGWLNALGTYVGLAGKFVGAAGAGGG
jgi:hypothetical protein